LELRELLGLLAGHVESVPLVEYAWMNEVDALTVGGLTLVRLREEALLEFVELLGLELYVVASRRRAQGPVSEGSLAVHL